MPIFEYHCRNCNRTFEALLRKRDEKVVCPACGSDDLERLFSSFSVSASAPARQCGAAPHCPSASGGCCGGHCPHQH